MAHKIRLFSLLLGLMAVSVDGVNPVQAARPFLATRSDPVLESWRWRTFHELEGKGVTCLAEGPDGSVYFGTDEGVRVYNGLKWGLFNSEDGITGAPVNALLKAADGSVYAGTETSLHKFNGTSWDKVFPPEGNLHWRFTDLEQARDGSIWAATNWGALRIKGPEAYLYTTDAIGRAVRRIAPYVRLSVVPEEFVPQRSIPTRVGLMSTPAGEGGQTEHLLIYAVIDGGPADQVGVKSGDRIIAVDDEHLLDPNTALLGPPGTVVNVTVRRDGQEDPITFEIVRDAGSETFKPFVVYDIKTARDGSVWFGLETGEVLRFQYLLEGQGATGLWKLHTPSNGLVIGEMPRIGQSPDGQIWVVSYTQQSGLNRFDGVKWEHTRLSALGGSDLNTSFATTPDRAFWVGGNSLNVFRNGKWSAYSGVPLIPTQRTRLLVTSDGALWVLGLGQFASRLTLQTSRWNAYEGLNFQVEAPDGSQWFLEEDNGVVRFDGKSWVRYGFEDGIMDYPSAVYTTKNGTVWVIGSHGSSAATAVMKGKGFERKVHPKLSWNVDERSFLEAQDGSIWLGAWVDFNPDAGQVGGLLQHKNGRWIHHTPPDAPDFTYGIAQMKDGLIWFAGEKVKLYDGNVWLQLSDPAVVSRDWTDAIYTTSDGDLWIGTRTHGLFQFDGSVWRNHTRANGLSGNRIYSINGSGASLWVATDNGISRFDGNSWVTQAVSKEIAAATSRSLGTDKGRGVWISDENAFSDRARSGEPEEGFDLLTIRYQSDNQAPDTEITVGAEKVSSPGNTVFAWRGSDPFRDTPDEDLQFAWRLNKGKWSRFDSGLYHLFLNLSDGKYVLEVAARDRDLNVDPTPARFEFVVGR